MQSLLELESIQAEHDCSLGVTGDGPTPCDTMIIGIAAGKHEWIRSRKPFTGAAGKILDGTLNATYWSRDKCFVTNLFCGWNDEPFPEEIAGCHSRLVSEVETVNPALIVCLDNIVSDEILGYKKWKRGHLYYKESTSISDKPRWYLPTIHPAAFTYFHPKVDIADFARDISKIEFASKWRDRTPPIPDFIVAESTEHASEILWSLKGRTAIDIESSYDGKGFEYPDDDLVGDADSKLLCFSVANDDGVWVIPGRFIAGIKQGWGARTEVEWIMHLGLFDAGKLLRLTGERLKISEDTLYQSYSLDERCGDAEETTRAVGVHGLKLLTSEFLGAEDYNVNVLKAEMNELHFYNACDTYYTKLLNPFFEARQIRDNVRDMYKNILIRGANVLSEIQERGVNIDLKLLYTLGARWTKEWLELEQELQTEAKELGWDKEEINFNSHPQMNRFIFDIMGARPHRVYGRSTRKEVLEDFAEQYPWCTKYQKWRGINHVLNNYIVGVEDDIKFDGRLHPEPIMHGTMSGRLSYHKPPVQTIPKHGVDAELAVLRQLFYAASGYVIIEADLKQGEMWATAYLSGDEVMLAALQSGDAHAETAKDVFHTDESNPMWKALRELGKLLNFGTLYNRQAKSYSENMWQGRKAPKGLENIKWTKQQAQGFINNWFKKFPGVKAWQKREIKKAFQTGEQQSVTGRKRRYWLPTFKTVNQSINIGPQTLSHDYLFNSLMQLHELLKPFDAHIWFEVHDALVIEANKKYLKQSLEVIDRVMAEPKFGFGGIPCDIQYGENWGKVHKIDWDEVEEWAA